LPADAGNARHQLTAATFVADAGISEASQPAIEDAGLSFILGTRIPDRHHAAAQWQREDSGQTSPAGRSSLSPGRPPTRIRVFNCETAPLEQLHVASYHYGLAVHAGHARIPPAREAPGLN